MSYAPPAFHTEPLIQGTAYVLPSRRAARAVVIGLMLATAVFLPITAWFAWSFIQGWSAAGDALAILPGLFMLPVLLGELTPLLIALVLWRGHNRIELRGDDVLSIDRLGPLRWTRRRARESIRLLEINTMTVSTNSGPPRPVDSFAMLMGVRSEDEGTDRRQRMRGSFILAWGYPRATLRQFAEVLAGELTPSARGRLIDRGQVTTIGIVETVGADRQDETADAPEQPVERPANALAQLKPTDVGPTLTVPPAGVWKGSKGLFLFSLMWNGFMVLFSGGLIFALFNGQNTNHDVGGWLIGGGVTVLFWGIGLSMLVFSIDAGRREAILDVVGDTLIVTQRSLFGTWQNEWRAEDLRSIDIGPSGIEVNNVPIMELQIQPARGRKVGLLRQLDDAEIRWIAYELRQSLGLRPQRG